MFLMALYNLSLTPNCPTNPLETIDLLSVTID